MERDSTSIRGVKLDRELSRSLQIQEIAMEKRHAANKPQRSLARSVAIVATCTAAMIVNISSSYLVAIALPNIGKSINIGEDQLQWLMSAYSLSSVGTTLYTTNCALIQILPQGCLLLFLGRLADIYGRKKAFLIGMLWQTVFALASGFANDGITLVMLRGFQGIGPAAAIPSALGILAQSFPPSTARSVAFATFAAGAPIGGAIGMICGGVLTQLSPAHWRANFFLSAGLSALCVLGCLASFDPDNILTELDTRVDWIGAILVTCGLVLIVFVLGQAPISGWKTPYIIVCLILGINFVGIFVLWERHLEQSAASPNKQNLKSFWTPPPLMKPSIWARARGRMAVILAVAFLNWAGFICWTFWVQLYYQNYLGLDPMHTMVRFIPMLVTGCLINFVVAMMAAKIPLVTFIVFGSFITGSACVLFALIDPAATYWAYAFPSTNMVVFGVDFVYTAGTIFVAKIVAPHEQSLAGGLFQTMTQIGTAFGLTVSTMVLNNVEKTQSAKLCAVVNAAGVKVPRPAQLDGYRAAQWTGAAFPFLAAVLGAIFLRRVGVIGNKKRKEEDPTEQTFTEEHGIPQP